MARSRPHDDSDDPFREEEGGEETWAMELDLHGLRPELAQRRLEQTLHAARVRGAREILVITGRGWGNLEQKPVLRRRIEEFLRSPGGRKLGVRQVDVTAKGGALRVRLG